MQNNVFCTIKSYLMSVLYVGGIVGWGQLTAIAHIVIWAL